MEAEKRVGEEVVEGCPRTVPMIGEFSVGTIVGDAILFPFGNICLGNILQDSKLKPGVSMEVQDCTRLILRCILFIVDDLRNTFHGFDTNDAL